MERVFVDTSVLYPISIADLLLRLADIAIHEIRWSEDLLAEVERVLVDDKGLSPTQAAYFCSCIREAFPGGEVHRAAYGHLIKTMTGSDIDDHLHAAAARVSATVLLTFNTKDFPGTDVGDVRVMTPDEYLLEVLGRDREIVFTILDEMGSQRRVPQSYSATLDALDRAGLHGFTRRVKQLRR